MLNDSEALRGFALAAVLASDRGGQRARPGLARRQERLLGEAIRLAASSPEVRATTIQAWIADRSRAIVPADVPDDPLSIKALAILRATDAGAPADARNTACAELRPDFYPDRLLVEQLRSTRGQAPR